MTNEVNEMSAASRGSQPVAWAVIPSTVLAGRAWRVTLDKEEAERLSCGAMLVVPLYEQPQPTLTDAEREAVERAAGAMAKAAESRGEIQAAWYLVDDAATLRGLLERTSNG
jgi:hypothetical protein